MLGVGAGSTADRRAAPRTRFARGCAFAAQQAGLRPVDLRRAGPNDVALDAAAIGGTGRGIIRRGKN
jgi:hypothetical protein